MNPIQVTWLCNSTTATGNNIQGQLFIQFSEEQVKSIFIDKSAASCVVEFILKNKMSYRHTYLHITVFIKPRKACFRTKNIDYHKICLVRNLSKSNGSKSGSSFSCNDNAYNNNNVHKLLLRTCIMKFQFLWILRVRAPCALSHMYTTAVINDGYYLV